MIITDYICSEIDFPVCKFISENVCKCSSRFEYIGNFKIYSPAFLGLILANMGLTFRMVSHVKELCSSIGRSEMKFFYYMYALSNLLQIFLISFKDKIETVYFLLTVIHLVINNMCFISLFVGSYTQDMFIGKWGIKSTTILYMSTAAYGFMSTIVIFFGLLFREPISIFVSCFIMNFIIGYGYFIIQFKKLNKKKGEIWAYGTILISFIFFLLSASCLFVGSRIIAILTDKYLDNLFFHNLFLFCSVVMIHKFWLSVCDYEVECLLLEV